MFEVICPACGGLSEGKTIELLYQAARAHTVDDHGYDVPRDHVVTDSYEVHS
ncbi:hypothetical protein [Rhodococcus sp. ACS1]|uniref:hypothetical protein n=1 Tax=Rhodococcus sp. ACS1 TaxID=2028570 RepID=UPI0015C91031|nr:hypothetical protein [Rhodococcus sp. ACS1]